MFAALASAFSYLETHVPRLLNVRPSLWLPLFTLLGIMFLLGMFGKVPLSYALGNLAVRWRTMLLTGLAFTLVVALMIVMLAFVNGMYALTQSSGHADNVIILSEGATDEGFSNLGFGDVGDLENQQGVLKQENQPLMSRETLQVVNQPIENPQPNRPKRRFLQIRGLDDPEIASQVHRLPVHPNGRWFSQAGVNDASEVEVVLGEGIAREMGRDRSPAALAVAQNRDRLEVNDTIQLNNRTWRIVGILKSSGSTFDSELWAKRALVGPMFGKENYTTLVARTENPAAAVQLKDFLNKEYSKTSVSAQVETDYFSSLGETNKTLLFSIAFVTFFMAIGGIFGVMNTMFAAISQRIKDIGVLRLLGFQRRHILATFLLESLLIALLGGLIGCAVGMLVDGRTANSIVSSGPGGGGKFVVLALKVDAQILAGSMLLSLSMGLLGGLIPSLRAMRWTALETLR
jgi:ABC-type lipoprotein release transport system permease subunit